MTQNVIRFLSVFVLILSPMLAGADSARSPRDLSGSYVAHGVGIDGQKYEADVLLTARGETYLITWHFTDTDFTGVGIRQGDVLAVGWNNHGKAGVVLYNIREKDLTGIWADGSTDGKVCTENLTRKS